MELDALNDEVRTVRLTIRGRVQGVGFRHWTAGRARDLDLDGWVRNRRDGTVEAVVRGARAVVDRMVEESRQGPAAARVDAVDVHDVESVEAGAGGFEQRTTL